MTESVARPAPDLPGRAFFLLNGNASPLMPTFDGTHPLPDRLQVPKRHGWHTLYALCGLALLSGCASAPVVRIDLALQGKPWSPAGGEPRPTCPQVSVPPLAPIHLFRDVSWDSAASWLDQASGATGSPFLPDSIRLSLTYHEDPCAGQEDSSRLVLHLLSQDRPVDSLLIPHSAPLWSGNVWELEQDREGPRVQGRWSAPFALGQPPVREWFQRMGRTFQSPEPTWFRSAIWDGIPRRVLHLRLYILHHGRRSLPDAGFVLQIDLDSLRIAPSNAGEETE